MIKTKPSGLCSYLNVRDIFITNAPEKGKVMQMRNIWHLQCQIEFSHLLVFPPVKPPKLGRHLRRTLNKWGLQLCYYFDLSDLNRSVLSGLVWEILDLFRAPGYHVSHLWLVEQVPLVRQCWACFSSWVEGSPFSMSKCLQSTCHCPVQLQKQKSAKPNELLTLSTCSGDERQLTTSSYTGIIKGNSSLDFSRISTYQILFKLSMVFCIWIPT